jgi:hypothetical protein
MRGAGNRAARRGALTLARPAEPPSFRYLRNAAVTPDGLRYVSLRCASLTGNAGVVPGSCPNGTAISPVGVAA